MSAAALPSSIWGCSSSSSSSRGFCMNLLLVIISSSLIQSSRGTFFATAAIAAGAASTTTTTSTITHSPGLQKELGSTGDVKIGIVLHQAYPGLHPQYESIGLPRYLFRRDCAANGSNYCFGNSKDYCPSCGNCCSGSQGQFCTPNAASTCCGDGYCKDGETCSNGQCASQVATTTATSTVWKTVTHFATALASVVIEVDVQSTVDQTVVVTTSNVDTATQVIYVTTTAAAANKARSTPQLVAKEVREEAGNKEWGYVRGYFTRLSSAVRRLVRREFYGDGEDEGPTSPFAPRTNPAPWTYQPLTQESLHGRGISTVTTTTVVTSTSDITSTVSATQTAFTTAVSLITHVVTQTSVLNAKTTVTVTSTIVQTPQQLVTQIHTLTTTLQPTPNPSQSSTTTSSLPGGPTIAADSGGGNRSASLPTPTIIGIAVGAAGAIIVAAVLWALWRVRQRRLRAASDEPWYTAVPNEGLPRTPLPPPPLPAPPLAKYHHSHQISSLSGATTVVSNGSGGARDPYGAYQYSEPQMVQQQPPPPIPPPRRRLADQAGAGGGGFPGPGAAHGHGRNYSATTSNSSGGTYTRTHSYTGSQGTTAPLVEAAGTPLPPRRYEMDGTGGGGHDATAEGTGVVTPLSEGGGGLMQDRTVSDNNLRGKYTYRG